MTGDAESKDTRKAEGSMKKQLIVILEALRLARAELKTHNSHKVENASRTIQRLEELLLNERVTQALGLLGPNIEGPSVFSSLDGDEKDRAC
jgi:hypothetical protein